MKGTSRILAVIMLVSALFANYAAPISVQATTAEPLVYEGFNYDPQYIQGLNGGTGWESSWATSGGFASKIALAVTSNDPMIYKTGNDYLLTSGRDVGVGYAYGNIARGFDSSTTGPLQNYIEAGAVGKAGTKLWGSYLHRFGFPAGLDTDYRAFLLCNGAGISQYANSGYQKISIGFFGNNSRLSGNSADAYYTLRIQSNTNPGSYPTANTTDAYYYDTNGKFLYIRMKDNVLPKDYTTHFVVYSINYTAEDATIDVYINPTLGDIEPSQPTTSFTIPVATSNMFIKGVYTLAPNTIYKAYYDEIRVGDSFAAVNPRSELLPQPVATPVLGEKIAVVSSVQGPFASNGQYLIDGIINDNTKASSMNNGGLLAYYTLTLPSVTTVASAKIYCGEMSGVKTPLAYYFTYYNGTSWEIIPGSEVWANNMLEKTIIFDYPVRSDKIRFVNLTGNDTKFRELELYQPATEVGFGEIKLNAGEEIFVDNFTSIDSAKWDVVGELPSGKGDATPPVWTSPNPTPDPNYSVQIVNDSAEYPLNWESIYNFTPPPLSTVTPLATRPPEFYAEDGKAMLLPPATNYYAFRAKTEIPSGFAVDYVFKIGRTSEGPVCLYFNENGTTSTGTGLNGYGVEVSNEINKTNYLIQLKRYVNGSGTIIANAFTNVKPYHYQTIRVVFKDGHIKVYQNEVNSDLMLLMEAFDTTYPSGNVLIQRQGNAWPRYVAFDSVKIYDLEESSIWYGPTPEPTEEPTAEPTAAPTPEPTPEPTATPTLEPTPEPTASPTPTPVPTPDNTPLPTVDPAANVFTTMVGDVGFETGVIGTPHPTWANSVVVDTARNSGEKSIYLGAGKSSSKMANQALKPNTKYRMSCYVKAPNPGVNFMFAVRYKTFGATVSNEVNLFAQGNDWVKISKEFVTPHKMEMFDAWNNTIVAFWTANAVYVDDIALEELEPVEVLPVAVTAVGISKTLAGTYTAAADFNLGDNMFFKVTTASNVDKLEMYFVELGYGETYERNDPRVTISGKDWTITRPISYALGANTIKFRTRVDNKKSEYSAAVTATATRFQSIAGVFVGTVANPSGVSASVLRGDDLYFKVTTSVPVTKLNMYFEELDYGETYLAGDPNVVSVSDTEWIIKRPITYYKGSLTIGFKGTYQGRKSDLSETVTVTTTN